MTGLKNWIQWRRRWKRKMISKTRRQQCMRRWRKQNRRRAQVNVSNGGGGGVFTGPGNWQQQWWRRRRKTILRTQQRRRRRRRRTMNRRCVWGMGENDRGGRDSATGPRDLQQQQRRWRRNMSTKNLTKTTEALEKDIWRVQWIGDNSEGGSGSTKGPMDWKQRWSVNFPCYCVANSNTVSYLSRHCIVLILFSSDSFFSVHWKKEYQYCNHVENIFVPSVQ